MDGQAARLPFPPFRQLDLLERAANERHALAVSFRVSLLRPLHRFVAAASGLAGLTYLAWIDSWKGFTDTEQAIVMVSGLVLGVAVYACFHGMLLTPIPVSIVRGLLDRAQGLFFRKTVNRGSMASAALASGQPFPFASSPALPQAANERPKACPPAAAQPTEQPKGARA